MIVKLITSLFASTTTGSKENSKEQPSKKSGFEIQEEGEYFVWNKGEVLGLSPYFSTKEFTCHCNFPACKKQKISKTLIVRLDRLRKDAKQPLIITSGFRCHEHQAFLSAAGVNTVVAKNSTHELGDAADVVPKDGNIDAFLLLAEKQFDSIGLAKNFLHLDTRIGKRRWDY